jgi:centrosomal protein CEP104
MSVCLSVCTMSVFVSLSDCFFYLPKKALFKFFYFSWQLNGGKKDVSFCLSVSLSFCLSVFLVSLSVYLRINTIKTYFFCRQLIGKRRSTSSISLCLSVSLSVSLSVCLSLCLSVSLPLCISVFLSLCLFVSLSFCLSVSSFLCSVYVSIQTFFFFFRQLIGERRSTSGGTQS